METVLTIGIAMCTPLNISTGSSEIQLMTGRRNSHTLNPCHLPDFVLGASRTWAQHSRAAAWIPRANHGATGERVKLPKVQGDSGQTITAAWMTK